MAERGLRLIWLEDARATIRPRDRARGWLDARRGRRLPGAAVPADAAAVVLFTSGSEGAPKGVVLSHRNILANIAQVAAVIDFNTSDRTFNAMPMFHAFGLTGATLLPLLSGVRGFLYPSPLHYRIVPELIYDTDSTVAFGTDTFLSGWARHAHPYDFRSVRHMIAGAEPLRPETRALYAERFGVRVLEGYGTTETAPVLALNTPMHSRPGSIGRLLPGIAHRLEPVPGIEGAGRLLVRGPNVMLGYRRAGVAGVWAPADGWHDTGDVCAVDPDGFLTLVARVRRFAKIAGEMVSMPAAEALALTLWPEASHAVVAVPDGRKGEALVLLTTRADATGLALLAHARARGVSDLGVPRLVRVVADVPRLATGKVDYLAATALAAEPGPPVSRREVPA
jgi:acyl-[acyl-carrier-protein]-phospholipid O-acyltransferase/long-chain-fatty-acid--[acyl-carrier-protein] ligase